jgi:hypothetical protein
MAGIARLRSQKVPLVPEGNHQDLKTTQVYLGKINDTEAIRWMDILHGK